MQRIDGTLIFSPSDLQKFVDCEHLTRLQVRVCDGELTSPNRDDEELELLRLGVQQARRGWLERTDVRNTLTWPALRERLRSPASA